MSSNKLPESAIISDSDFRQLKAVIKNGKLEPFIQAYKQKNPELSNQDILTLGLIELLRRDEILLSKGLLRFIHTNNYLEPEIFTTLDQHGKNAILYALEHGICIPTLASYIFDLTTQNLAIPKFSMDSGLMHKVKDALTHPVCEIHPTLIIKDLIVPLYTKEAVDSLIDLIGQEWLDSYYI